MHSLAGFKGQGPFCLALVLVNSQYIRKLFQIFKNLDALFLQRQRAVFKKNQLAAYSRLKLYQ